MATTYLTIQNDRLDHICRNHYGSERGGNVEAVLAANHGLADRGPIYPIGVLILLPDLPTTAIPQVKTVQLWN